MDADIEVVELADDRRSSRWPGLSSGRRFSLVSSLVVHGVAFAASW